MKTRLLKRLRAEARDKIQLLPNNGNKDNCFITRVVYDSASRGFDIYYYFRRVDPAFNIEEHSAPDNAGNRRISRKEVHYLIDVRNGNRPTTINLGYVRDERGLPVVAQGGFELEEAVKVLQEKRREYILEELREMKKTYYKGLERKVGRELNAKYNH